MKQSIDAAQEQQSWNRRNFHDSSNKPETAEDREMLIWARCSKINRLRVKTNIFFCSCDLQKNGWQMLQNITREHFTRNLPPNSQIILNKNK